MNFLEGLTRRHPVDEGRVNVRCGLLALFLRPNVVIPHWLSEVREEYKKFLLCGGTNRPVECSLSLSVIKPDNITCELVVIICNEPAP